MLELTFVPASVAYTFLVGRVHRIISFSLAITDHPLVNRKAHGGEKKKERPIVPAGKAGRWTLEEDANLSEAVKIGP
jgi:hypothetical protein